MGHIFFRAALPRPKGAFAQGRYRQHRHYVVSAITAYVGTLTSSGEDCGWPRGRQAGIGCDKCESDHVASRAGRRIPLTLSDREGPPILDLNLRHQYFLKLTIVHVIADNTSSALWHAFLKAGMTLCHFTGLEPGS